jgi:hypothetical protein
MSSRVSVPETITAETEGMVSDRSIKAFIFKILAILGSPAAGEGPGSVSCLVRPMQ